MAHPYHHMCGCAECCAIEEAEEREEEARDAFVERRAPELVKQRLRDEEATEWALEGLMGEPLQSVLLAAGKFIARIEVGESDTQLAEAAMSLFRDLRPHAEDYLQADAERDARAEYEAPSTGPRWHEKAAA